MPQLARVTEVESEAMTVLESARDEVFEDGTHSSLSRGLLALIRDNGAVAVEVLANLIVGRRVDDEAASETLRFMGRVRHLPTHSLRLWLLERCLNHPSAPVRDGALLGIASLRDPRAAPHLRAAMVREPIPGLREDMEQTLEFLENPDHVSSPENSS